MKQDPVDVVVVGAVEGDLHGDTYAAAGELEDFWRTRTLPTRRIVRDPRGKFPPHERCRAGDARRASARIPGLDRAPAERLLEAREEIGPADRDAPRPATRVLDDHDLDGRLTLRVAGAALPQLREIDGQIELLVPVKFEGGKATIQVTYDW